MPLVAVLSGWTVVVTLLVLLHWGGGCQLLQSERLPHNTVAWYACVPQYLSLPQHSVLHVEYSKQQELVDKVFLGGHAYS